MSGPPAGYFVGRFLIFDFFFLLDLFYSGFHCLLNSMSLDHFPRKLSILYVFSNLLVWNPSQNCLLKLLVFVTSVIVLPAWFQMLFMLSFFFHVWSVCQLSIYFISLFKKKGKFWFNLSFLLFVFYFMYSCSSIFFILSLGLLFVLYCWVFTNFQSYKSM